MGFLSALRISASGLTAQRLRMDVIANNIANVDTTRTLEGGPYLRQRPIFRAKGPQSPVLLGSQPEAVMGVQVAAIVQDPNAVKRVYQPDHPDADAQGYVQLPDINLVTEMTDMLSATRAYEANVTVMNAAKSMAMKALELIR